MLQRTDDYKPVDLDLPDTASSRDADPDHIQMRIVDKSPWKLYVPVKNRKQKFALGGLIAAIVFTFAVVPVVVLLCSL